MISTPRHTCKVAELNGLPFDLQLYLTAPSTIDNPQNSICSMMNVDYTRLLLDLNLNASNTSNFGDLSEVKKKIKNYYNQHSHAELKRCDQGWVYDDIEYDETAAIAVSLCNFKLIHNFQNFFY